MELHCFGTTGYHPSPTRHTACYYLPELALLLDAGTALFRLIQHLRNHPKDELDIVLSHAHLDHTVGLTFLIDAIAVTKLRTVRIHGESDKLDAVRNHLYHELLFPVSPAFEFLPFSSNEGKRQIGEATVCWFPLEHPGGSVGFTLQIAKKKFAYITDTVARPNAAYLKHIHNCDLLLHECYFDDSLQELAETTGHSWLSNVQDVVRTVQPKRTALIHINPLAEIMGTEIELDDEQRNTLNIEVATDGLVLQF